MDHNGRILVVDDEPVEATLLKTMLERDGHTVVAVTASKDALDVVARGDVDVVLTDFTMPGLGGLELCERILGMRPNLPVILVTGHATFDVAVGAMRVGAYDFVTKPVEKALVQLAITRALEKSRLTDTVHRLERAIEMGPHSDVFGSSSAMRRVQEMIARIAPTEASVLVAGETGTGKERVARALHDASGRKGAFVALNCAAIPANLIESELFGHARGAYTDAHTRRDGLFIEANHGTIFLDEIGELPLEVQPKLLRALQERKVRPIGSNVEVSFDARLVCATNRDLEEEVAEKRFREDLYYRINVIQLALPALRERGGDVIELATQFLAERAKRSGRPALKLSPGAAQKLLAYEWPGNVRELENCIERVVVVARQEEVVVHDLPEKVRKYEPHRIVISTDDTSEIVTMSELERRYVRRVLAVVGGNKVRAAQVLGVDRKTLYRKLKKFGIALREYKPS